MKRWEAFTPLIHPEVEERPPETLPPGRRQVSANLSAAKMKDLDNEELLLTPTKSQTPFYERKVLLPWIETGCNLIISVTTGSREDKAADKEEARLEIDPATGF